MRIHRQQLTEYALWRNPFIGWGFDASTLEKA
jgi:hypothetical protein